MKQLPTPALPLSPLAARLSLANLATLTILTFALPAQAEVNPPVPSPGVMTWKYEYDALGQRTKTIDPNGNVTTRSYDALKRPNQIIQPQALPNQSSSVIKTDFDGSDRILAVTDPRNLVTRYTVNGLGNTTSQQSPDSGLQTFTQDAAGNIISRTDARGKKTTYTYDALNRLLKANYPSGTDTVYEYDGGPTATPQTPNVKGKLTKVIDESGSTAYTYDGFGRLSTKTQTVGTGDTAKVQSMALTYGIPGNPNTPDPSAGQITSMTYPSGGRLNLSYDTLGRLSGLSWSPVNLNGSGTNTDPGAVIPLLTNIQTTAFGAIKGWSWGNGTATPPAPNDPTRSYLRTYDLYGRMTGYPLGRVGTVQNPIDSPSQQGLYRTLGYDNAGRLMTYLHLGGPTGSTAQTNTIDQTFAYDGMDRLIWANVGGSPTYGYEYDATGNRTLFNLSGSPYAQAVSPTSNRVESVQIAGEGNTPVMQAIAYDAAGNTTLTSSGSTTGSLLSLVYSDRGRLKQLKQTPSGSDAVQTVSYLYNGLEQRVKKSGVASLVPSGAGYYFYDEGGRLLGEYNAQLVPLYETVYLNDMPVALIKQTRTGNAKALPPTLKVVSQVYNVYSDHIDTPRMVTRASDQSIVWSWTSAEPFGRTQPNNNPNNLGAFVFNQRFPGQIFDSESNLHQNWNREYQSLTGNYLQTDPIGLAGGSMSLYSYVGGNPLGAIDPTGLTQADIDAAFNAAKAMYPSWRFPSTVKAWSQKGKAGKYSFGDKDIYVDSKYLECLDNGEATALLNTILHELAHFNQTWYQFGIDNVRERATGGNSSNAQDKADALLWQHYLIVTRYLKNRDIGQDNCQCRK